MNFCLSFFSPEFTPWLFLLPKKAVCGDKSEHVSTWSAVKGSRKEDSIKCGCLGDVCVLVVFTAASVLFFLSKDGFGYLCAPGPKCVIFYHLIGKFYRCVGAYLSYFQENEVSLGLGKGQRVAE